MSFNSPLCDGTLFQGLIDKMSLSLEWHTKWVAKMRHPLWHIIGNGKRCHQNNDPLVPDESQVQFWY